MHISFSYSMWLCQLNLTCGRITQTASYCDFGHVYITCCVSVSMATRKIVSIIHVFDDHRVLSQRDTAMFLMSSSEAKRAFRLVQTVSFCSLFGITTKMQVIP